MERLDPEHLELFDALWENDRENLLDVAGRAGTDVEPAVGALVGNALLVAKEGSAAIELLDRLLLASPDDFWLHIVRAEASRGAEDYDGMVRHATAATAIRPGHAGGWRRLSLALQLVGRPNLGVARKAGDLARHDVGTQIRLVKALLRTGDFDGAAAVSERISALEPRSGTSAWSYYAWSLGRAGHLDEAEALVREIIERSPGQSFPWLVLAEFLDRRGDSEAALDALLRAEKSLGAGEDQVRRNVLENLGVLHHRLKNWRELERVSRALAESDPNHARAHLFVADALLYSGQVEQVLPWIERAIELSPPHALPERIASLFGPAFQDCQPYFTVGSHYDQPSSSMRPKCRRTSLKNRW